MNFREAHKIWIAQCEAAETVRARFGLRAAFNYIVGEKLINLVEAASDNRAFAQELPRFIFRSEENVHSRGDRSAADSAADGHTVSLPRRSVLQLERVKSTFWRQRTGR